ncbi:MAG TPA: YHS domain-containing protein, partial [Candidatus Binatia bacterium]|nr:YHS domain-containing protein [Candidatus Binatia bacterium]
MIDPVCGMQVDPDRAAAKLEHDGRTYAFCCDGCRDLFRADPAKYLATPARTDGGPHAAHGHAARPQGSPTQSARHDSARAARFTCPMHPEVVR